MEEHAHPDPVTAHDWDALRALLQDEVDSKIRADSMLRQDLVQEACVRLLRALRRRPDLPPRRLVHVIALRTVTDHFRNRYRHRAMLEAAERGEIDAALPEALDPALGGLLERMELIVLESFRAHGREECRELAIEWFTLHDWTRIAAERGTGHAAVRKRWSRCLTFLRELLEHDDRVRALSKWGLGS